MQQLGFWCNTALFPVYIKFFGHQMVTVLHQNRGYQGRVDQGLGVFSSGAKVKVAIKVFLTLHVSWNLLNDSRYKTAFPCAPIFHMWKDVQLWNTGIIYVHKFSWKHRCEKKGNNEVGYQSTICRLTFVWTFQLGL